MPCHTQMAAGRDSSFAADVLPSAWTTERLKKFLKEKGIPVSGLKHKLITKAFKELQVENSVNFEVLPQTDWCKELPKISEDLVCKYLSKLGGYTKNFRTGVRLCQCGHVYDIESKCSNFNVRNSSQRHQHFLVDVEVVRTYPNCLNPSSYIQYHGTSLTVPEVFYAGSILYSCTWFQRHCAPFLHLSCFYAKHFYSP